MSQVVSTMLTMHTRKRSAVLSDCGRYRYQLLRAWNDEDRGRGFVHFIMLNPSTADAEQDDPTIRRCEGFARVWGYSGFRVSNLFAYRATDPAMLECLQGIDPAGPANDQHIESCAAWCSLTVCAWGNGGSLYDRGSAVRALLHRYSLHCLRLTKANQPGHPLYLPRHTGPVPWPQTAEESA